ncbi:MAG: AAA family ATPase, partial [Culicoidibacterales bacterium]
MIHGAICGKFRIIHVAHKELMIQAMGKVDHLHIFVCDVANIKRYASILETKIAIGEILKKYDTPFTIHVLSPQELIDSPAPSPEWDRLLLSKAGQIDVIFDSKEVYGNTLLHNEYINLFSSKKISASDIEKNPYGDYEANLIAPEFMRFMNKKVVLTGIESCGKTTMAKKLADFFHTTYSEEYGKYYSNEELGSIESCYQPKDFVHIANSQLLQDKLKNKKAHRMLIVDTDPIVTLFYL